MPSVLSTACAAALLVAASCQPTVVTPSGPVLGTNWRISNTLALYKLTGARTLLGSHVSRDNVLVTVLSLSRIRFPAAGVANGDGSSSFLGIPYAEPPLGSLRWRAPVAKAAWSSVWNATQQPNLCMQPPETWMTVPVSEDCLYIDVYVPPGGLSSSTKASWRARGALGRRWHRLSLWRLYY